MQVFAEAAAARQAKMDDSPVLLVQRARADLKRTLSEAAEAEQEPSLAAAKAAAAALAAACRALAAEALLASLALSLAEVSTQVCQCTVYVLLQLLQAWLCWATTLPARHAPDTQDTFGATQQA